VRLQEEVLTDIRNTETQTYPIVKIGIQYWMGRSLEATHYTDGKAITLKKDFTTTAGYYTGKFKDAPQDFYFTIQKLLFQASYHLKDGVFLRNRVGTIKAIYKQRCF